MNEIEKLPPVDPWSQLPEESDPEYALFIEFCKLGPTRTKRMLAAKCEYTLGTISGYYSHRKWFSRSKAYDSACNQLVPTETILSPTETLAYQHAVGTAMLKLGIQAIQLKNPGTIKVGDAVKLVAMGSELQRKAQGTDSGGIQIHFNGKSVDALNEIFAELDALEANVVEEEPDIL